MQIARNFRSGSTSQNIQVSTQVGLLHVVDIKFHITPCCHGFRRSPRFPSPFQFFIADIKMQSSVFHVELDHVAILDQRKRSADC